MNPVLISRQITRILRRIFLRIQRSAAQYPTVSWPHRVSAMQAALLFWLSLGTLLVVFGQIVPGPDTCPKGTIFCKGSANKSRCLREEFLCDGLGHCSDLIDEKNCTACKPGTMHLCGDMCRRTVERCDGFQRCKNGKDEAGCGNIVEMLRKNDKLYFCNDGTSRRKSVRCDGVNDCPRAEDELGCTAETCTAGAFFCNGRCKGASHICDGAVDCKDGIDELDCPAG